MLDKKRRSCLVGEIQTFNLISSSLALQRTDVIESFPTFDTRRMEDLKKQSAGLEGTSTSKSGTNYLWRTLPYAAAATAAAGYYYYDYLSMS